MIGKSLTILLFISAMNALTIENSKACEIYFQVENAKESYEPGDELVVTVTLELTHRNCPVKPEETQFKGEGIEIVGATQWIEISPKHYARKLKIKITGMSSHSKLTALRECEKDGGKGSIMFERAG